jgi:acyl carrier protein
VKVIMSEQERDILVHKQEVLEQLKGYIAQEVLHGESIGLNEQTPLLEWGILNSFEIVGTLGFIEKQFHIQVPIDKIVADHLINLLSITELVLEYMREGTLLSLTTDRCA